MNFYRLWSSESTKGNPIVCSSNLKKLGIKEESLKRCQKIDLPSSEIIYDPGEEMFDGVPEDFVRNTDFLPVCSPRLIETLNANGIDNIQYIPVKVIDFHGNVTEGYKIANILTALSDTIDKENSILEYRDKKRSIIQYPDKKSSFKIPGKIEFVWRYAIKGDKAAGHDLFRLKYDSEFEKEYSDGIFVSERFRKIITANRFTGVTFSKIITV